MKGNMQRDSLAARLLGVERRFRRYQEEGVPAAPETQALAPAQGAQLLLQVIEQVGRIILGKESQIRLTLACLLARGHLLIEDIPGVGKTTLAHALASTLGLKFQRIQFTSDLLPADITGVSIFERDSGIFKFHPGPIFAQMILADEVNRATPKAQSALLEAMEEHQVTTEGETRALPEPFFVIATQNPSYQVGTFPLPESQLDRFLMCLHLGYPDVRAERLLLEGRDRRDMVAELTPHLTVEQLSDLQQSVRRVHAAPALFDYLQALIAYTRQSPELTMGLSPRCGLNLLHAAQAWAFLDARNFVLPEDIQAVLPSVVRHRVQWTTGHRAGDADEVARKLLAEVPVP
jgi:MoxR-like ATPase